MPLPTVVWPSSRRPPTAAQAASSHRATRRGEPRTGTSPERRANAVSASVTVISALPTRPACKATVGTIRTLSSGSQNGRKAESVIEEATLQRVLTHALRTGGDFAEVFAEDRRTSAASLDDG